MESKQHGRQGNIVATESCQIIYWKNLSRQMYLNLQMLLDLEIRRDDVI